MPEAFAVLLVVFSAIGAYVVAFFHGRNSANHNPQLEREHLQRHEAWLRERLQIAERERWSADMVETLAAELGVAARKLAKISVQANRE